MSEPTPSNRAERAFLATLPALRAIPSKALHPVNVDPEHVARVALATARQLEAAAPELAQYFPNEPPPWTQLETRALALIFANSACIETLPPPIDLVAARRTARCWRDRLAAAVRQLVVWEVAEASAMPSPQRCRSERARNIAAEIVQLLEALRPFRDRIEHYVPQLTSEAFAAAAASGDQLFRAVALRPERREHSLRPARLDRRRAFTAVVITYERVRGALRLMRGEDEVDALMPALRGRRSQHKPQPLADVVPSQ